jgi:predicted Holliday junction resolvase-like endonuclease
MKKSKIVIIVGLVICVEVLELILQHQACVRLQAEVLARQHDVNELPRLLAENQRLSNRVASAAAASSNLASQQDELNRLRTKVATQDRQLQALQTELAVPSSLPAFQSLPGSNRFVYLPRNAWNYAGYSTPEAALQSMLWATFQGNMSALRASLTPEELARRQGNAWKDKTEDQIAAAGMQGLASAEGLQILNIQMSSEDQAHFTLYFTGQEHPDQPLWFDLKRIDGEWKADGAEHRLTGL